MKASDLMAGDWVNYVKTVQEVETYPYSVRLKNYQEEKTKIQVYSINGKEISYKDISDDRAYWFVNESYLEPIELTEDILRLNMFTAYSGLFLLDSGKLGKFHYDPWNKWIIHENEDNLTPILPCQYVHELQHFLRLCNHQTNITL